MALTGNKLKHMYSTVPDAVPDSDQMDLGQLAINAADEKIFIKNADGDIVSISGGSLPETVEKPITVAGANTINVPNPINPQGHSLLINGLAQSSTAYSISGQTVVLPTTLSLMVGDVVIFNYFRS